MENLPFIIGFFLPICLFVVFFAGMVLFNYHASKFENGIFEEGEIDSTYYPDDEDNVIFRS